MEEICFSLAQSIVMNVIDVETFLLAKSFIHSFEAIKQISLDLL